MSPSFPPPKAPSPFCDAEVADANLEGSCRGRRRVWEGGGGELRPGVEDADVQCGGEGRHDERKYNNLLCGENGS